MARALTIHHPDESGTRLLPVAQYVRMSTDHQRYSIANQKQANAAYAAQHGMIIVATYTDGGRSGLTLRERPGLQKLLDDVIGGSAGYGMILVYDVSRWGRFQDTDEGATYEFMCRTAGVNIVYCAEPFPESDTPLADIVKAVKRSMAGEFSRDLGEKCHRGHCRLASLGYHQGAPAAYALRRVMLDETRNTRRVMQRGQAKAFKTDRVVLVPGPLKETRVVRRIFHLFADKKLSAPQIANDLNSRGIKNALGRLWQAQAINRMLKNERYAGNLLWNQRSARLKSPVKRNPSSAWIKLEDAIEPIVPKDLWNRAQARFAEGFNNVEISAQTMLEQLQELLKREGRLTSSLIDSAKTLPSASSYRRKFGTLARAFLRIGYVPEGNSSWRETFYTNWEARNRLTVAIASRLSVMGVPVEKKVNTLRVDNRFTVAVITAAHQRTPCGNSRWVIRFEARATMDFFLARRVDESRRELDYYLVPNQGSAIRYYNVGTTRAKARECYRTASIQTLFDLVEESRATGRSFLECHCEWANRNVE
jgi:DNA invertase Pin-like site-specific DNA recombinase